MRAFVASLTSLVGILMLVRGAIAADVYSAVPERFQGHWAADETECARVALSGSRLTITEDQITFYESRGRLLEIVVHEDLNLALILEATGEGYTWLSTKQFELSPDGMRLTDWTGGPRGAVRIRCAATERTVNEHRDAPQILASSRPVDPPPRWPALPDLEGITVPSAAAMRLNSEADNPEWSRPMESSLLNEFVRLSGIPVGALHAACRSVTCGVLYDYSTQTEPPRALYRAAQQVADDQGFAVYQTTDTQWPDGTRYFMIYFGDSDFSKN